MFKIRQIETHFKRGKYILCQIICWNEHSAILMEATLIQEIIPWHSCSDIFHQYIFSRISLKSSEVQNIFQILPQSAILINTHLLNCPLEFLSRYISSKRLSRISLKSSFKICFELTTVTSFHGNYTHLLNYLP